MDFKGKVISMVWKAYGKIHGYRMLEMSYELYRSLEDGNVEEFRRMIETEPSLVLYHLNQGLTPMHIAARHGHSEILSIIFRVLKRNFLLNKMWMSCAARDDKGNTPLHVAVKQSHWDIANQILQQMDWMTSLTNIVGETALFLACEKGRIHILEGLLAFNGSDLLNVARSDGQTCAHIAAFRGHSEALGRIGEVIKTEGLSKRDNEGMTPLHLAILGGNLDTVNYLIEHVPSLCHFKDNLGRCPIHLASNKGDIDIMSAIVSRQPDCLYQTSAHGKTVLHYAVQSGSVEALEWISHQMDDMALLSELDNDGNGIFHALVTDSVDNNMATVLLNKYPLCGVNAKNKDGYTPLGLLCRKALSSSAQADEVKKSLERGGALAIFPQNEDMPDQKWEKGVMKNMALVTAMVATITGAAPLQINGDPDCTGFKANVNDAHCQDYANSVGSFLVANNIALVSSMTSLLYWILCEFENKSGSFRVTSLKVCRWGFLMSVLMTGFASGLADHVASWGLFKYGFNIANGIAISAWGTAAVFILFIFINVKSSRTSWKFNSELWIIDQYVVGGLVFGLYHLSVWTMNATAA